MFCDIEVPGGLTYEGDPRWILKSAIRRARDMGFDDFVVAPELEFYFFRSSRPESGIPEVLDEGGYFDLTTLDAGSDVRRETVLALDEMGVHVDSSHHEAGPSQHEIDFKQSDALSIADAVMTARIVVKEYAMKEGWHATFMPKPLGGHNGSGMHIHQSLSRDGENAFYDAERPTGLSGTARAFIAGQLRHSSEMAPLYAQWVNSYKRLVPGFEAPVYLSWSRRNRSSLIRVPQCPDGEGSGARAEFRCPDPACNPYLALAGMLQAGLEGIEKGYDLPENAKKKWPTLYFLHGLFEDHERWIGRGGVEVLDEAIKKGDLAPVVALVPNGGMTIFVDSVDGKQPYARSFC